MNKRDHIKYLKNPDIDWCDIGEIIIDLELEKFHLQEHLTAKQIQEYDEIIELYETYRFAEISKQSSGYNRLINAEFQGEVESPDEMDGFGM